MPERETIRRAKKDAAEGKASSTQAGEFVREEMHHVRGGKHGARSAKQAIAIGLSKARRSGVKLPPRGAAKTRRKASRDLSARGHKPSARRSRAAKSALSRESKSAASRRALSRQGRVAAKRRSPASRRAAAARAARTKGPAQRRAAARKAARTRAR